MLTYARFLATNVLCGAIFLFMNGISLTIVLKLILKVMGCVWLFIHGIIHDDSRVFGWFFILPYLSCPSSPRTFRRPWPRSPVPGKPFGFGWIEICKSQVLKGWVMGVMVRRVA